MTFLRRTLIAAAAALAELLPKRQEMMPSAPVTRYSGCL